MQLTKLPPRSALKAVPGTSVLVLAAPRALPTAIDAKLRAQLTLSDPGLFLRQSRQWVSSLQFTSLHFTTVCDPSVVSLKCLGVSSDEEKQGRTRSRQQ